MSTNRSERKRIGRPGRAGSRSSAPRLLTEGQPDPDAAATVGERAERGARPIAVYRHLQEMIVRGHLAPGSPLVETEIAGRLRLSRTPVRVALQRLHQQGFIVEAAGTRLFKFIVAPLTREDALALYHIVAELDGLSARYAAGISAQECRELAQALRRLNNELRAAAEARRPDHNRIYELDHVFHRRYVEAAANPRLLALLDAIKPQVERYSRVYATLLVDEINKSISEHDTIVDAIEARDADGAQYAARANWRNAGDRLATAILQIGERGSWW